MKDDNNDLSLEERIEALEKKLLEKEECEDADDGDKKPHKKADGAALVAALRKRAAERRDALRTTASKTAAHRSLIAAIRKSRTAAAEDNITQKSLTSVEGITRTPNGVTKSIRTKLRAASASLDRIADYLEKTGRREAALRIDRVADEIDLRLAKLDKKAIDLPEPPAAPKTAGDELPVPPELPTI